MALAARRRTGSDEHYLIDICDRLFQRTACRQHRFPFLLGDRGKNGRQAKLPVDAYYPDLRLVVEVMERQHCEGGCCGETLRKMRRSSVSHWQTS